VRFIRRVACPAALVLAVAVAAPAQADISASSISAPSDPRFVLDDLDASQPATIAVAGTATGSGSVDIVCVRGTVMTSLGGTASGVPVAGDGTFSVPDAPLGQLAGAPQSYDAARTCRLHAVPSGTVPTDFSPYAGPRLGVSTYTGHRLSGAGANDGILFDYYVYAAGLGFAADYVSFGGCGIYDTIMQDPVTFEELGYSLYCNGFPVDRALPAPGRFGVKVDGAPAYAPGSLGGGTGGAGLQDRPGFPALTVEPVQLDAATGDVTIRESDPFAKCAPDNSYPPTTTGCASLAPVPVALARTTEHTRNGQVIRVVDRWSSTDGHAHALDLSLQQDNCFGRNCSSQIVYRFPGEAAYAPHDADDATPATGSVPGPLAAAEPLLARDAADPTIGGTAVLPAQSSDGATFLDDDSFTIEYANRVVPASGELTLTHYYVSGRTPTETEQLAAAVTASLRPLPAPPAPPAAQPPVVPAPVVVPARPQLSRHGKPSVRRKGATFVVATGDRVRCPTGGPACRLRVSATVRVPASVARLHKVAVASTKLTVKAGRTAKVTFRLNRKGARALKRLGRLRLTVTLSARTGAGTPVAKTRTVTIKAPGTAKP
jgi:hypothetical protein